MQRIIVIKCLKFYFSFGFPLFPCHHQGAKAKAPLTQHGFKDASLDWQQIEAWYHQFPGCAWGSPTSADRNVMDIDPRNGGVESFNKLIAQHGPLPATPKVKTGGAGYHYWLKFPPGTSCGKVANGIDLKADGGYVIVPPSKILIPEHQGRAYTWEVRPWEIPIAEAPAWVLKPQAIGRGNANDPWIVQEACVDLLTHPGSPEGERRRTLCQLVGVHLARGDSEASVYAMAQAWASRCQPPLEEWRKHVVGLLKREAEKMTTTHIFPTSNISPETGRKQTNSEAEAQGELIPSPEFSPQQTAEAQGELVCSLPPAAKSVEHLGAVIPEPEADAFPQLPPEAYHGLFGEMLRAIEPQTEADPSGILLGWLTCFGNVVGRGAWSKVGPRLHHPALYVGIVGRTSDAKGDSWACSLYPFKQVEPAWASTCIANGVGSGEGLVERVCDEQTILGKDGEAKVIPGAEDKRCLLRLSELSQCFKLGRRENATLSENLRTGWDGDPIHIPNRKGNALLASDYAISMIGDITPGMVRKLMENGTEAFDGWANRFLWAVVRRSRFLPSGGSMDGLSPYLDRLQSALAFAKQAGELRRDADAERLWEEVYPSLCTSGDSVPHTDRAKAYALRLSMLYALADGSKTIKREHLAAALASWSYCRQSARLIFGSGQTAEPEPLWVQLLNAITKAPGINRTGLREAVGHKVKAEEIDAALAHLERSGLAYKRMVQAEGGGRPAECWYPGKPEPEGDGDKPMNDNHHTSSPWIVQHEAGREGNNSADSSEQKRGEETPGREITNSGQDAQAELIPSPASAGSKLPGTELIPSPPERGANSQAGVSSLPPQQNPNPEKLSPNDEATSALPPPVKPMNDTQQSPPPWTKAGREGINSGGEGRKEGSKPPTTDIPPTAGKEGSKGENETEDSFLPSFLPSG